MAHDLTLYQFREKAKEGNVQMFFVARSSGGSSLWRVHKYK